LPDTNQQEVKRRAAKWETCIRVDGISVDKLSLAY